jgi:two-component system LytT family response regulator
MDKSKNIKAIIIDDSIQARKLLRLMLAEYAPEIELITEAENVEEGIIAIETHKPDVVFLDIEMPGKSGIQLAEELVKNGISCDIVFTTAYNGYAINAFRLSAIDYLLKPIDEKQLIEAIEKIKSRKELKSAQDRLLALTENLKPTTNNVLCIPIQSGYEYIPIKEIEYLEADGSYVQLLLIDGKQKTISKNLKYFEQILEQFPNFVRVHRSSIINMDNMISYSRSGRGTIIMKNGKEIDIARDRKAYFLELLEKFNS